MNPAIQPPASVQVIPLAVAIEAGLAHLRARQAGGHASDDHDHLTPAEIAERAEVEAENHRQFFGRKAPARVEEYRPTFQGDIVEISKAGELEWLGFSLGLAGEAVAGSPEHTEEERAAFLRGHAAGFAAYEEECWAELQADADYQDWVAEQDCERLDAMMADPNYGPASYSPDIPFAELVEAVGVVAARQGGPR